MSRNDTALDKLRPIRMSLKKAVGLSLAPTLRALASVDTRPKGGDEGNTSAPFTSGAVRP